MKRAFPVAITMAVGLVMIGKFFFEESKVVTRVGDEIEKWAFVVAALAYLLGIANLTRVNAKVVLRRGKDWPYKLVLLLGMYGMIVAGLAEYAAWGSDLGASSGRFSLFNWSFRYVMTPLASTMFSLLAFFIASAAFRAFRARSIEAALLLAAALAVMLGRVPLGSLVTGGFASGLQVWILTTPSLAGQRAIIIGAGIGLVGAALRIVLGIERPYLR